MSNELARRLLIWVTGTARDFWIPLVALALITAFSGKIRRSIDRGLWGETSRPHRIPPLLLWSVLVLPAAFWALSIWASRAHPDAYLRAAAEDGGMEYAQVFLLLAGSLLAAVVARSVGRLHRRAWPVVYGVLAVALFVTMGEEISWGQRIFGFETPEWLASVNRQEETNLHNLPGVDDELSIFTDVALIWCLFVVAGFRVTGLYRLKRLETFLWLPHPALVPAWLCVVSFGVLFAGGGKIPEPVGQLQESRELVLYFGVVAFLLFVLLAIRARREPAELPSETGPSA